jgi:hypothetical protein
MMKAKECNCTSEYQDKKYGKGIRIHNACGASKGNPGYRCTVCGNQKMSSK